MMFKLIVLLLSCTAPVASAQQGNHLRGNQFDHDQRELATMMMMPNVTVMATTNMTQDDMKLVKEAAMMALNGTSTKPELDWLRKYSFYKKLKSLGTENVMYDIFSVNEKMLRNDRIRLALSVAILDKEMKCIGAFKLYLKFTEKTKMSMPTSEVSRYGKELSCPTNVNSGNTVAISSTANASGVATGTNSTLTVFNNTATGAANNVTIRATTAPATAVNTTASAPVSVPVTPATFAPAPAPAPTTPITPATSAPAPASSPTTGTGTGNTSTVGVSVSGTP